MNQLNVGISEFRANMSAFLQQVQAGNVIRLMYRGSEIARLVPPDYARIAARQELDALRETAVVGDILSPIDETWSASQ
jgi:antitoxin (DNA-binding transcriptional repressor) of toxin-antitoxin stability system